MPTTESVIWRNWTMGDVVDADKVVALKSVDKFFLRVLTAVWRQEIETATEDFIRAPSGDNWNRLAEAMKAWQHVKYNLRTTKEDFAV